MTKIRKTCLFLSSCFVLLFSGVALSDDTKVEKKNDSMDMAQIEMMQKKKCLPLVDERYYMMIIGPNCHSDSVDPEIIVKKKDDPNIHPELRIIDPYTRKELTGNKGKGFGLFQHKLQPEGKRYETPGGDSK